MNEISSLFFYDQRIVISVPMMTPIVWQCSKIENTNPKGISRLTFAQTRWNEHQDAFCYSLGDGKSEFDSKYYPERKVIGMYADYYSSDVTPTVVDKDEIIPNIYGVFTWNADACIKVGGSYKKFTLTFYNDLGEMPFQSGDWFYEIDGNNANDLVSTIFADNILKVKFIGGDSYIGSVLKIKYITKDKIETSVDVDIVGL